MIDEYTDSVAEFYGVPVADVTVTTSYETTGSLTVTTPDDLTEAELVDAITN